jgi:rhomboid protease GluP
MNADNERILPLIREDPLPREETYVQFLKNIICPLLKTDSFIFAITIANIAIYILTIIFFPLNDTDFLSPSSATLLKLGARSVPLLKKGEIYRWLTSGFLHANIQHIFVLPIIKVQLGNSILYWKHRRAILQANKHSHHIYALDVLLLKRLGSNLLGAYLSPEAVSVGASGAVFGLFGCAVNS